MPLSTFARSILLTSLIGAVLSLPVSAAANLEIVQTTRQGDRLTPVQADVTAADGSPADHRLVLDPATTFQTLVGIGGSFTESSAYVLSELSAGQREKVLAAYFSPEGAHYSLTRTHIASCDFSLRNYTYASVPGDTELVHFSIEPDRTYLLPMIKAAQALPGGDFKILASPWTAPPWPAPWPPLRLGRPPPCWWSSWTG